MCKREVCSSQLEHLKGADELPKNEDYLSPIKSSTFKKERMKEGKELETSMLETITHLQNNVYAQEEETVFSPLFTQIFSPPILPEEMEDTN